LGYRTIKIVHTKPVPLTSEHAIRMNAGTHDMWNGGLIIIHMQLDTSERHGDFPVQNHILINS